MSTEQWNTFCWYVDTVHFGLVTCAMSSAATRSASAAHSRARLQSSMRVLMRNVVAAVLRGARVSHLRGKLVFYGLATIDQTERWWG
jgi:hypothetical protein